MFRPPTFIHLPLLYIYDVSCSLLFWQFLQLINYRTYIKLLLLVTVLDLYKFAHRLIAAKLSYLARIEIKRQEGHLKSICSRLSIGLVYKRQIIKTRSKFVGFRSKFRFMLVSQTQHTGSDVE